MQQRFYLNVFFIYARELYLYLQQTLFSFSSNALMNRKTPTDSCKIAFLPGHSGSGCTPEGTDQGDKGPG